MRKEGLWMIVLSVIVLLPNIYFTFYGKHTFPTALFLLALSCLFFILPALFLRKRIFFILQGLFVLLAPFEIGHIYLNRMPATSAFLLSIIDTNPDESYELLSAIKFPLIILLLFWAFYFFVASVKISNTCFFKSNKMKLAGIVIFIAMVVTGYSTGLNKKIFPYDLILRTYQVFVTKKEMKEGNEKMKDFKFDAEKKDQNDERKFDGRQ
ncbi:hypothetical protein FACS1894145_8320 [Bacteroidia bacterium]|nr:hypothetical protein FACS1894145_8320 [Bacteroidia bacterium]